MADGSSARSDKRQATSGKEELSALCSVETLLVWPRGLPLRHPSSVLAQRLSRWFCGRPKGTRLRVTRGLSGVFRQSNTVEHQPVWRLVAGQRVARRRAPARPEPTTAIVRRLPAALRLAQAGGEDAAGCAATGPAAKRFFDRARALNIETMVLSMLLVAE